MRVSLFMNEQEAEEMYAAYNAVFDNKGKIKACGRDACIHLIQLMKKYTSEDVGDENTGRINIEVMKEEYCWLW